MQSVISALDAEIEAMERELADAKAVRELMAERYVGKLEAESVMPTPNPAHDAPGRVNDRAKLNARTVRRVSQGARIRLSYRQAQVWEWWLRWGKDHGFTDMSYRDLADLMQKAGEDPQEGGNWVNMVGAAMASLARRGLLYRAMNNGVYTMPQQYRSGKHTYKSAIENRAEKGEVDADSEA